MFVSAGLLIALGLSGTTVPVVFGAISRVVAPEKRSWAMGVSMAIGSLGQFLLLPGSSAVIRGLGWSDTLLVLAGLSALMLPLSVTLTKRQDRKAPSCPALCPERGGWPPRVLAVVARVFCMRLPGRIHRDSPAGLPVRLRSPAHLRGHRPGPDRARQYRGLLTGGILRRLSTGTLDAQRHPRVGLVMIALFVLLPNRAPRPAYRRGAGGGDASMRRLSYVVTLVTLEFLIGFTLAGIAHPRGLSASWRRAYRAVGDRSLTIPVTLG